MLKNLKHLRQTEGISQKQLAESIGVSQQSINKYENHKIEPDIDTMIALAEYFQTSVDYLVGHTEVRRKIEETATCELNAEELFLVESYRSLSRKRKDSIRSIIDSYQE